jgi:membrane protease YdiL (CAAX protease family)
MTSAPSHPAPPERPEVPDGVAPAPREGVPPPWPVWSSIGALFAALASATVLGVLAFAIGGGGTGDDAPAAASIVATFLQDLCFIGAAVGFAALVAKPRPWQFGLRPPRSIARSIGYVTAGYVTFLVFTAIWLTALGRTDTEDDLPDELGVDESTAALVSVALLVTVVAPIAEELLFRGYIFGALRRWRGVWPGAIITGLLFGAVHGGSSHAEFLLPLAVLGTALCIIYAKSGSLYPCIGLHCLNNSVAFGTTQDWSGAEIVGLLAGAVALITLILWTVRRLAPGEPALPATA